MSTCFKIVVSQPSAIRRDANGLSGAISTAGDSVCSATFIDLRGPLAGRKTARKNWQIHFDRKDGLSDLTPLS